MHAPQLAGDRVEVGDDVVAGHVDVPGDVCGERAVAAACEQLGTAAQPAVAVQRDRDVDVVEELREPLGLLGPVARRRQVMRVVLRMAQQVHRCARRVGSPFGDDVGHLLQSAAVDRHEAEPGPKRALLEHAGVGEQL